MFQTILAPPENKNLSNDAEMRNTTLNVLLVGFTCMVIVVIAFLALAEKTNLMEVGDILYITGFGMLLGSLLAYWMNRKGKVYLAGSVFILLLIVAVTVTDTPRELLVGRSLVFFIIPVMLSSFVLRSYASFLVAVLVSIEHTVIWMVTDLGIMFNPFGMIAFFSFAYIAWQAARIMENALAQAYETNLHLDELVAERTQELVKANGRLTELDALKSKFVADVSHELRTPISNISIYLEMLEANVLQLGNTMPRKAIEFMSILRSETARLADLINDVLTASQIEQRIMNAEREVVDGNRILLGVVETNRVRAEDKGLVCTLNTSSADAPLLADQDQIKQVFTNLISNAINYTAQGSIHISSTIRDHRFFVVQVKDTGMGIEQEDISHIFERFYRGKQASKSTLPGTGLGLAITKEIIEAHEGQIEVQSELDVGTTVMVSLPLYETLS